MKYKPWLAYLKPKHPGRIERIMSNVDLSRYKRIVQAFWDPEPKNDDVSGASIWCLGKKYSSRSVPHAQQDWPSEVSEETPVLSNQGSPKQEPKAQWPSATNGAQEDGITTDREWPSSFLDDCESRIWFTYRSNFPPIKRSSESSMTFSVRLRSLGDQTGFTSDTGWGCMIRSGQSILANALVLLRLGRGKS